MQDAFRILGSGRSSKTTKKNQHHKFPSGLGDPKPGGEGRRRILHTFSDITINLFSGDQNDMLAASKLLADSNIFELLYP